LRHNFITTCVILIKIVYTKLFIFNKKNLCKNLVYIKKIVLKNVIIVYNFANVIILIIIKFCKCFNNCYNNCFFSCNKTNLSKKKKKLEEFQINAVAFKSEREIFLFPFPFKYYERYGIWWRL